MKTIIKNISTYTLIDYIEYDRDKEEKDESSKVACAFGMVFNTNIKQLTEDIRINGIKNPLTLNILGNKALLTEGNHRMPCAVDLLIESVATKIEYVEEIEDETYKAYIMEKMSKAIEIKKDLSLQII